MFDFYDTFNPVLKGPTLQIILILALTHKLLLRQVDVNNAFLHGDLVEVVFITQPPGFEKCDEYGRVLVCQLHKVVYGLKQVPRVLESLRLTNKKKKIKKD